MKVKIEYSAQMKKSIGHAVEEMDLPESTTVQDLVVKIATREGEPLSSFLLDATGQLGGSILLFLNDEQVLWAGPGAALKDGDVLTIATPIAGGRGRTR